MTKFRQFTTRRFRKRKQLAGSLSAAREVEEAVFRLIEIFERETESFEFVAEIREEITRTSLAIDHVSSSIGTAIIEIEDLNEEMFR